MKKSRAGRFWGRMGTAIARITLVAIAIGSEFSPAPILAQPSPAQITQQIDRLKNSNQHWIEINLTTQRLVAWQGNVPVFAVIIATGKPATPTEPGIFRIANKQPQARLRGSGFDVPDVPSVLYYNGGAIHGAYWIRRFGRPISHGTVYMAADRAQWLYDWAAVGTPVIVR
ncbi:MAG: L,D-transpeptidase, partial [Cyanobacteriota bacterium]|nr:L,D-transpeptidase [Cyanobacteriota bacterium]